MLAPLGSRLGEVRIDESVRAQVKKKTVYAAVKATEESIGVKIIIRWVDGD